MTAAWLSSQVAVQKSTEYYCGKYVGSAAYVHLAMLDAAETAVPEICTASTTCSAVISSPVGRGRDLKKTRRRGHPPALAVHAIHSEGF